MEMVRQIGHIGSLAHRGFAAVDLENGAIGNKIGRFCRMGLLWMRRGITRKIVELFSILLHGLLLLFDLWGVRNIGRLKKDHFQSNTTNYVTN